MFSHDSFFFVGIFVLIFLFWLVTGGPTHPISFTGPLLAAPDAIGGGSYISLPKAPGVAGTSGALVGQSRNERLNNQQIGNQLNEVSTQADALRQQVAQNAAFGTPSTYRSKVYLDHYLSKGVNGQVTGEYVQLHVSANATGPISLSGWSLKSDVSGNSAVIPKGTEVPMSGIINESDAIVLNPGDSAIIATGRSPIGASFRENVCIGYFAQFQSFSPSLPNTCPVPLTDLKILYKGNLVQDPTCIDYVDRQPRCKVLLSPPQRLSGACQNFLTTNLNYNGCVSTHRTDPSFKDQEWRIYLGRDSAMWRNSREVVKLLDTEGKTVDMFTY